VNFEKPDKQAKTLDELIEDVRRKFGKGALVFGSELVPVERVSTGISKLDKVLGGGWPKGRITEIWGPQSAGKSSLVYACIAAVQKADPKAKIAYFDQENTFSPDWAELFGIDLKRLVRVAALPAEVVGELIVKMVRAKWDMVVVDSVVELLTQKELERGAEEASYAVVASFLSRLLPKIVILQSNSPTVVLLVNQVRDKIGFFLGAGEKSPGGHALFHLDTLKLRVQRKGFIESDKGKRIGIEVAMKLVKSKLGGEQNECRLQLVWGKGFRG